MLSYIDPILFPDNIRILEIAPEQFVYPIFKNGSRSLEDGGFRVLSDRELTKVTHVTVYVRQPFERFTIGVRSYLGLNPTFDKNTVVAMINDLLFLNSHFSLQFHWLLNLARHIDPQITIKPIDAISEITPLVRRSIHRDHELEQDLSDCFKENQKLQFYLKLDKVLTEVFINKTIKFSDIVQYIKTNEPELYKEVIQRSKDICSVLD